MFTEKNFAATLKIMGFTENGGVWEKNWGENILMSADLKTKKFSYPAQLKNRDRNNFFDSLHKENFVVFECVNRLLDKGYKPEDIMLEKAWHLGHTSKSGRADICVSHDDKTLFIIECKTFGTEFKKELKNLIQDGGQLFSYRQQEISCQWLVLYASDFVDNKIIFESKSISCHEEIYKNASTVKDFFQIWSENFQKQTADDVIFHDETVAYKIGIKPFRKKDLKDFPDTSIVNDFEEILRHNHDSNKPRAFDVLTALLICKLADENSKSDEQELDFQFKFGRDDYFTFQDRLRALYKIGMLEFMNKKITDISMSEIEELFFQLKDDVLIKAVKEKFREQKFFTTNYFSFIDVDDEELFYKNAEILQEVVNIFKDYRIIGAKNLQTLGDLFEQLLDKGFKQDEGMFFTPIPITRFIWDSLPLEKIISAEKNFAVPKIIDYACGAGHFLTQGFEAINSFFARENIAPPFFWEDRKIFGVEKDNRLARVSKISLFMHGADKGIIKRGDGLEDFPDENISPNTFDVLVSNPPYSIKEFKQFLQIKNHFDTLEKISINGKEIETLFVERIPQLLKPGGIAAVILPSSIFNKDGKSFVTAREKILQNFYIRAIAEFGSKTFGATGTKTNILFLEKVSPKEKFDLFLDTVNRIFSDNFTEKRIDEEIFNAWLDKINVTADTYKKFVLRGIDYTYWQTDAYFGEYVTAFIGKVTPPKNFKSDEDKLDWLNQKFYDLAHNIEREKIQYFAMTYTQKTLIISAPDENTAQEKFLGYTWSNRKGDEGIKITSDGLLYDKNNRRAENKLAAAVRKSFYGEQVTIPDAQNYFYYLKLADMIDFSGVNFIKIIKLVKPNFELVEYSGDFETIKLEKVAPYVTEKISLDEIKISDYVTTDNMLQNKRGIKIYEGEPQISSVTRYLPKDILISNIRPYLKKIWFADRDGGCSNDVLVFRSFDENKLLPEYLFIILSQDYFFDFMMSTVKGLKMPRGDKKNILNFEFPLPTIEEQKKIVEEFREVDDEISAQEKIIAACDTEVKEKFSEMFLTKDFPREKLGNCLYVKGGDTFPKNYQGSKNISYVPFYKVSDMNTEGNEKFMTVANNYVEENILTDEIKATIFEKGTIIFPKVGMAIGTNKKRILSRRAAIDNNTMAIWSQTDKLTLEYLFSFFNFCVDLSKIANNANPPSISATNFNKETIPIPPKELQEKFAEYVSAVENKKSSAQKRLAELKTSRENLAEKYFR